MKKSKINIKDDLKKFWIKYNSFIINGLIPTILFTIIFFSFYPGIMTYDGNFQWKAGYLRGCPCQTMGRPVRYYRGPSSNPRGRRKGAAKRQSLQQS